jgi:hypothetical protein
MILWLRLMVWVLPCPLIFVQRTINDVNKAVSRQGNVRWRRWEVAVAVMFGLFWLVLILAARFPEPTTA